MIDAKIQAKRLSEVIDIADAITDEVVLQFLTSGLRIAVVDKANVAMVWLDLPASEFTQYDVTETGLGIINDKLIEFFRLVDGEEDVSLSFDTETWKLSLSASGLTYVVSLIRPEEINTPDEIPSLPWGAEVTVEVPAVKRSLKASDMVSDHVTFTIKDDMFCISASDEDGDDTRFAPDDVTVKPGSGDVVEECESKFSLDYLKEMFKPVSSMYTRIHIAEDMPTLMTTKLESSEGEANFILAPRIAA